jgi:cysteinyl-tRNA synthetase
MVVVGRGGEGAGQAEAAREQRKAEERARAAAKRRERLARGAVPVAALFTTSAEYAGQFSAYDAEGIPTHDAAGEALSKKRRKAVEAAATAHVALHAEYLAAVAAGEVLTESSAPAPSA